MKVLVLPFLLVVAAGAEPRPVTLHEAIDLALSRSPELLASRSAAEAARSRAEAAARLTWPRLDAGVDAGWTDNPAAAFAWKLNRGAFTAEDFDVDRLNDPDGLAHVTTSVIAAAPIDAWGRLRAVREAARAGARAEAASAEEALQQVKLGVVEAWHGAVLAHRALVVTERALDAARARETDVGAAAEVGAALQADLLRARARRRQREAELETARGEWQAALAALQRATGSDAPVAPVLSDVGDATFEGEAAEWTERALARRGGIGAGTARREAAEAALRAERRSSLPELGLQARVSDDRGSGGGQVTAAVGAAIRWSPFDPTRDRRRAAATAEAEAAGHLARAAADQVRFETEAAWARAHAARRRLDAARGAAEEAAEALRVIRERRQAGMATLTDELETESAALAAELEEARAEVAAALELARLQRAAGEL